MDKEIEINELDSKEPEIKESKSKKNKSDDTEKKKKDRITDDNLDIKEEISLVNPFRDVLKYIFEIGKLRYKTVIANVPKELPKDAGVGYGKKDDNDGKDNTISENDISRWLTKGCKPWYSNTVRRLAIGVAKSISVNDRGCIGRKTREAFICDCGILFGSYNKGYDWYDKAKKIDDFAGLIEMAINLSYQFINEEKNGPTNAGGVGRGEPISETTKRLINKNTERPKKIAAFDFDGTLLRGVGSSWEVLYKAAGITNSKAKENYMLFRAGKISYPEWVDRDVEELKAAGLKKHLVLNKAKELGRVMENIPEGIAKLKEAGYVTAIISGGVDTVLAATIKDYDTLFDVKFINKAVYDSKNNALVDIIATPYDWSDDGAFRGVAGKNMGLKKICARYSLTLNDAIFVGDAENDLKAMTVAGRRILIGGEGADDLDLPDGFKFKYFHGEDFLKLADRIIASEEK